MIDQQSWHAANADRQREQVRQQISRTCAQIRSEVLATYDPKSGLCRYPLNKGKLTEAEFLRRACIDKNTLKRDYHKKSRRAVRRLISWTASKGAEKKTEGSSPSTAQLTELEIARHQLDDLAEKFAIAEMHACESQRSNEELGRKIVDRDKQLAGLKAEVVRLTEIIIELRPRESSNVVAHPTRREL